MTDEQWEEMRTRIEGLLVEHVNAFVLIAEVEDENGVRSIVKMGTRSNAMAIGLASLLIHDVNYARDRAYEDEDDG